MLLWINIWSVGNRSLPTVLSPGKSFFDLSEDSPSKLSVPSPVTPTVTSSVSGCNIGSGLPCVTPLFPHSLLSGAVLLTKLWDTNFCLRLIFLGKADTLPLRTLIPSKRRSIQTYITTIKDLGIYLTKHTLRTTQVQRNESSFFDGDMEGCLLRK